MKGNKSKTDIFKNKNMKLLSTAAIATTLFSFVAADISPSELHQRALKAISIKNSNAFRRELVSAECLENQITLDETGINTDAEVGDDLDITACEVDITATAMSIECDYAQLGYSLDSEACTSAGGGVIKIDYEMDCDATDENPLKTMMHIHDMPVCLHTSCDAGEYVEFAEDFSQMEGCEIDLSVVSGAAIGSTSIISIALVSLFAMIW